MKATELISALQELIDEQGDMPVFIWPHDGQKHYDGPKQPSEAKEVTLIKFGDAVLIE